LPRTSASRPLSRLAALALAAGLAACGSGGSHKHAPGDGSTHVVSHARTVAAQLRPPSDPSAVLVRVGPYAITGAMVSRVLEAELRTEPASERPVPPSFAACVAHLRAESAARSEAAQTAQLRGECQARYQSLLQGVLDRLIAQEWLVGGARELGVPAGEHVPLQSRARLASAAIRRAVAARLPPVTQAQVASYYAHHQFQFIASAERDVKLARILGASAATRARAELAAGKSFATVVRRLTREGVHPTAFSVEGLVVELQPHTYGEPNLNEAIFEAKPGVLSQPINTWYGYFVFKVEKVRFQHEKPLAAVQASIRRSLEAPRQAHALADFIKRWRARWSARTTCSPADVVPLCPGFTGPPAAFAEGPPTLE
jgi:foldase protein PrsA